MATINAINSGIPIEVTKGGTGAATLTDHGALIGSGTGAVTALTVGTDGQVLLGSSAADPVFATLASAAGTITYVTGAGTLNLETTAASVTQVGGVELATDAEAIAGSDTTRAVVPSALTAKLGTQTDHGVALGSGTTAALTYTAVGATGEIIIGNTGADPTWLTAGTNGYVLTAGGAGVLPAWEAAGVSAGVTSIVGDTGTAIDGITTLAGGTNITTSSTGSTATINLDASPSVTGSLTAGTGVTASNGNITIASGGNLVLPDTTNSPTGMITMGGSALGDRHFHNYGTNNIFVGPGSGNVTTTGSGTNSGFGNTTLMSLTTGSYNSALGSASLTSCTSGQRNSCNGFNGLLSLTTGNYNTTVGSNALLYLLTGSNNICIGTDNGSGTGWSGQAYVAAESNNILVGSPGVVSDGNTIRIGTQGSGQGQQDTTFIAGVYNTAVGATAGVVLSDSTHQIGAISGATGTILIGGTKPSWLAAGTDGYVLTGAGSGNAAVWEYPGAAVIAQTNETGTTYTLVLTDAGKLVTLSNAAAITMTVPPNASVAFPIGTQILLAQIGAGTVTVAEGSGVTINSAGAALDLFTQYSTATLVKTGTDEWLLTGDIA